MKKIIIAFAIIALFAIAFGAFGDLFSGLSTVDDITTEKDTLSPGTSSSSTDSSAVSTESSYTYSYVVNIYKQGTTTKLGDIELDSNNNSAMLSISGNVINLDAGDKIAGIQFTDFKSVDTLSITSVSPGTTSVYITYTEKSSSSTHTHSYTTTKAATCTTSGTKSCSCGATQTIAATGHDWDLGSANDCQQQSICFTCEAVGGPVGPHTDWNDDNKCDLCDTSM